MYLMGLPLEGEEKGKGKRTENGEIEGGK